MSRMPKEYMMPFQIPLYWRDEQSGELPRAVARYFDYFISGGVITPAEIQLLREYCVYFINAPCWEVNLAGNQELLTQLNTLRERATSLASAESIFQWNDKCHDFGIDPF